MPTILVVEGEPAILDSARLVLARHGYRVLGAAGAAGALRAFASARGEIDLLVTEVTMPGEDGPTLAARLREVNPELPVLFVSGRCRHRQISLGGGMALMEKPLDPQSFAEQVNALLASPRTGATAPEERGSGAPAQRTGVGGDHAALPQTSGAGVKGGTLPAVLVVDDEPAVLDFMRFVLAMQRYTVLTAASVPEALRAFATAEGNIDLLITDVVMPIAGGPTLAKHLLELKPDLPVLFVSGFCEALPEKCDFPARLLTKPFTPSALSREVDSLLARPRAAVEWAELRQKAGEIARKCVRLALKYEGLDERAEDAIRRSRKLLGQE